MDLLFVEAAEILCPLQCVGEPTGLFAYKVKHCVTMVPVFYPIFVECDSVQICYGIRYVMLYICSSEKPIIQRIAVLYS